MIIHLPILQIPAIGSQTWKKGNRGENRAKHGGQIDK